MGPSIAAAEQLAHDAIEACGTTLTREQFRIFAWCEPALETAGWAIYCRIVKQPN